MCEIESIFFIHAVHGVVDGIAGRYTDTGTVTINCIQGVSGGIVNILGGGSMYYSE